LLEIWPEIEADLWILGAPLDARYRRAIRDRGLEGRVRHFGKVADPAPYYRSADFFVHPTFYDACANTVLQAMASGLPCIVSERDGASEFVAEGESGLRLENPADTTALHGRVTEMLTLSPEQRERMGTAARERMRPLTWGAHVARWEEVIARVNED
jgi:glycosyltransferase involved in cell wall biosynthesis